VLKIRKIAITSFVFLLTTWATDCFSKNTTPVKRDYGGDTANIEKPLEVRGQTRQLNMILTLGSKKDEINFIKLRENYEEEILTTEY